MKRVVSGGDERAPKRRAAESSAPHAEVCGSVADRYAAVRALVACILEHCPRSSPPRKVEAFLARLLRRTGVRDTTLQMRKEVYNLRTEVRYLDILADLWHKMQLAGIGPRTMASELAAVGIDWQKQDVERTALAQKLLRLQPVSAAQPVRYEDMLLGCGIGDAFGAGVEFWDGRWIHEHVKGDEYVVRRGDPVMHFYYRGSEVQRDPNGAGQNFMPGMYTDDCEMTVGLIHALMNTDLHTLTQEGMLRHWEAEYFRGQSNCVLAKIWALAGIGRNGHGGIADVYAGSLTVEALRTRVSRMRYPGNAPPMRALPLAFIRDTGMLVRLAWANADATHPHPKARTASLGIALAGRFFILEHGAGWDVVRAVRQRLAACSRRTGVDRLDYDEETDRYLAEVDNLPAPGPLHGSYEAFLSPETLSALCGPQPIWGGPSGPHADGRPRLVRGLNADAQRTLGCVLYLLKHHVEGRSMDTLLRSIYVGGDVDSLAALCLAFVGAREGLRFGEPGGLPVFMLQKLEAAEYISRVAKDFEAWVQRTQTAEVVG